MRKSQADRNGRLRIILMTLALSAGCYSVSGANSFEDWQTSAQAVPVLDITDLLNSNDTGPAILELLQGNTTCKGQTRLIRGSFRFLLSQDRFAAAFPGCSIDTNDTPYRYLWSVRGRVVGSGTVIPQSNGSATIKPNRSTPGWEVEGELFAELGARSKLGSGRQNVSVAVKVSGNGLGAGSVTCTKVLTTRDDQWTYIYLGVNAVSDGWTCSGGGKTSPSILAVNAAYRFSYQGAVFGNGAISLNSFDIPSKGAGEVLVGTRVTVAVGRNVADASVFARIVVPHYTPMPVSPIEKIERDFFADFDTPADKYARTTKVDYIEAVPGSKPNQSLVSGSARCFPAPDVKICGEVDPNRGLLAMRHGGESFLLRYSNSSSLSLPAGNLSSARTASGISIGSTIDDVMKALGRSPAIFKGKRTQRLAYGYINIPRSGSTGCPVYSILFVFDGDNRVEAMQASSGC